MPNATLALIARLLAALAVLLAGAALAEQPRTCFLLHEVGKGEVVRKGGDECNKQLTPASTFKIPHGLIALETSVLKADEEVELPKRKRMPAWGGKHTLASATRVSSVPFFQRAARLIGPEREAYWLAKLDYGNKNASGPVDQFWLNGRLKISPAEQVAFLSRLFEEKLPVSAASRAAVLHAIEQAPGTWFASGAEHPIENWPADAKLWAKSGLAVGGERVSWYVGAVERAGRRWVFASRVEGGEGAQGAPQAIRELRAAGVF
jgi:beta-lactamase class D